MSLPEPVPSGDVPCEHAVGHNVRNRLHLFGCVFETNNACPGLVARMERDWSGDRGVPSEQPG